MKRGVGGNMMYRQFAYQNQALLSPNINRKATISCTIILSLNNIQRKGGQMLPLRCFGAYQLMK